MWSLLQREGQVERALQANAGVRGVIDYMWMTEEESDESLEEYDIGYL